MSADLSGPRQYVSSRARGGSRSIVLTGVALFACTTSSVGAQPPSFTERQAVEMALSQPAYRALETSRIGIAESIVAQAGLPPNPTVAAAHERSSVTSGRSTESALQISQAFDISGRRTLRREAAERRLDAAQWDRNAARNRLIAEVRQAFGEALYRERLGVALRAWTQRIDDAYKVIAELVKGGEASGYERRRLERERFAVEARKARADAEYRRAVELLLGLTGPDRPATATPVGDLTPPAVPPLAAAQAALRNRPELHSLLVQAEAFDRERVAAERAWIPDLTFGAGAKRVEEPGRSDTGPIVSLSIPLALFDRGQAAQKRASAEAAAVRAEQTLRLNRWDAELRASWAQAEELRRAAVAFRKATTISSRDLSRIAEAAYRGGEATLLELLDAYRNELEAETTALELELAARQARIELDVLAGMVTYE
jgi:cobalt-zinc-cadmium efflux system outer membrane protein